MVLKNLRGRIGNLRIADKKHVTAGMNRRAGFGFPSGADRCGNGGKRFGNMVPQNLCACVSNGNDRHELRPVPVAVELHDPLPAHGAYNLGVADGQAVRVGHAPEQQGNLTVANPLIRTEPLPPLLYDYGPFFFKLGWIENKRVGPFTENRHGTGQNRGIIRGNFKLVHSLVEGCVRVHLGTESHTDGFKIVHEIFLRETLRSLECHVLNQMGNAALIIVFKNRSGTHNQTQLNAVLRFVVFHDHPGNTVFKRPC